MTIASTMKLLEQPQVASRETYQSQVCLVPFHCTLSETTPQAVIKRHNSNKLLQNEYKFNKLYKMMNAYGWNNHLSYVFVEGDDYPLIRIIINPDIVQGTRIQSTGIVIAVYNLALGRVFLSSIFTKDHLHNYYGSMHHNPEQVTTTVNRNAKKGYSVEDFVGYLEYVFRAKAKATSLPYSRNVFIKNWMMSIIAEAVNYKFHKGYMEALLGDIKNWHPYFQYDISLAHLEFLFTRYVHVEDDINSKFGMMMNYLNSWNGKYRWSPEEMKEIGKLPIDWVRNIYQPERE